MLMEPRDAALARNKAAPALTSNDAASAPLCGNTEMPVVTPVRTALPSIWNSLASASASCSASAMPASRCVASAVGDVLGRLAQILRAAGTVEHRHAAGQEQPQAVLGADRVFFSEQAMLPDRRLVARDDQLGLSRIENIRSRQSGSVLAPAVEDVLGATIGEKISSVADPFHGQ